MAPNPISWMLFVRLVKHWLETMLVSHVLMVNGPRSQPVSLPGGVLRIGTAAVALAAGAVFVVALF